MIAHEFKMRNIGTVNIDRRVSTQRSKERFT